MKLLKEGETNRKLRINSPGIIQGKYILMVLVLVVIVAGGILAWQYFKPEVKITQPEIKITQKAATSAKKEIKESEEKLKDETADWKIYRNEEYGFEIKYPENYKVNKDSRSIIITFPSQTEIEIKKKITNKSLTEWVASGHLQWQQISINNIEGIKAKIKKNGYGRLKDAVMLAGDKAIFSITLLSEKSITENERKTFDQIVSTFRFLGK